VATVPFVALDPQPDRHFECVRLDPEWNGWAVPVMTVAQVLAVVDAMPGVSAIADDAGRVIRIRFPMMDRAGDDILFVGRDGLVRWDGWTWTDGLAPTIPCEVCGAAFGVDCAVDCTSDEATRFEGKGIAVPDRILTVSDSVRLGMVCEAAERKSKVGRLIPDDEPGAGLVVVGTARSIGDQAGNFATRDMDVRDCYLRVTTTGGFDTYWLMSRLMDEVGTGNFVPDYQE
jgi:hypothetical protein